NRLTPSRHIPLLVAATLMAIAGGCAGLADSPWQPNGVGSQWRQPASQVATTPSAIDSRPPPAPNTVVRGSPDPAPTAVIIRGQSPAYQPPPPAYPYNTMPGGYPRAAQPVS